MGRACRLSRVPTVPNRFPLGALPLVSAHGFFWPCAHLVAASIGESRVALRVRDIKRRFLVPRTPISSREYKLAARTVDWEERGGEGTRATTTPRKRDKTRVVARFLSLSLSVSLFFSALCWRVAACTVYLSVR